MERVLIVDDDQDHRMILRDVLESTGYACQEAEDGTVALDVLMRWPADLVLTDLHMPRTNGFELINRMRGHIRYRNTPVILITSQISAVAQSSCCSAPVSAVLAKPYDWSRLLPAVRTAIDRTERANVKDG